jgi:hypothetical protein
VICLCPAVRDMAARRNPGPGDVPGPEQGGSPLGQPSGLDDQKVVAFVLQGVGSVLGVFGHQVKDVLQPVVRHLCHRPGTGGVIRIRVVGKGIVAVVDLRFG